MEQETWLDDQDLPRDVSLKEADILEKNNVDLESMILMSNWNPLTENMHYKNCKNKIS